jgi:uncharacterized protein YunC (DUF1805 family)
LFHQKGKLENLAATSLRRTSGYVLKRLPRGYLNYQREKLEQVGKELGVKRLDNWYSVSRDKVCKKAPFLNKNYQGNLLTTLKTFYPHHPWNSSQFSLLPKGYWNNLEHQREKLEQVGKELGVKQLDDWYSVSREEVCKKAPFLNNNYQGNLLTALKTLYPHHPWNSSQFSLLPKGYWNNLEHQREKLEQVGKELGVKQLDDWYSVSREEVCKKAPFLNNNYQGNLLTALKTLYPHHPWNSSQFSLLPKGYWNNLEHQREKLEQVGKELGVKQLDDWYSVSRDKVCRKAPFLIGNYQGNLLTALKTFYPHHPWNVLLFVTLPHKFWGGEHHELYRETLLKPIENYKIQKLRDWYKIPKKEFKLFRKIAVHGFRSEKEMLKTLFPDSKWEEEVATSAPELRLLVKRSSFPLRDTVAVHVEKCDFSYSTCKYFWIFHRCVSFPVVIGC